MATAVTKERRPGLSTPMRARHQAIRTLIEKHQDEFDQLLGDARAEHGLPRDPSEITAAQAQKKRDKQMEKLQNRFTKLQEKHQGEMAKLQEQMLELQNGAQ